jgi:hypothetical protein
MIQSQNTFQAISDQVIYVLDTGANLWLERGPFGAVPPARQMVDANVWTFQVLSETEVFVLKIDGTLWIESLPAGAVSPTKQQVDRNVALVPLIPPAPEAQITVPDVIGWTYQHASEVIVAKGLLVRENGPTQPVGPNKPIPTVRDQEPGANALVDRGNTVTLIMEAVDPQ